LLGLLLKKHSNQADSLRTEYVSYGMVLASAEKEMVEIQTRLVNEAFNARLVCPVVLDEETNRDRSADQIAEAITKFKGRKGAVIFINDKKLVSKKKYIQKKTGMSCSFIFKTDLSIITEMAKTLLVATENQTIDTLCGIVNRSDMFGKFMENFIGNNHD
jgi:hypothetical protein